VKIALVILHADPRRGGAERYTVDLAALLAEAGHQVDLLTADAAGPIPSVRTVFAHSGALTRAGRYGQFLESVDRRLDAESYDIVHAMLPVNRCDIYHPHAGLAVAALLRGHEKRSSAVMSRLSQIGNQFNRRRRRFAAVERQLLTRSDGPVVICLSEYVKRSIAEFYPMPAERLATLFNAVDLEKFNPCDRPQSRRDVRERLGLNESHRVALFMAQDFARKGLAAAIDAAALVDDPALRLVVVGRQSPAPYVRHAANRGIASRVIFAGATDEPADFYRAADFFILPTRHDPCSLVVLEALAMGLPVISTIQNGACEIMQTGVHGLVLDDPSDIPSLAAAIRELCDDARRTAMARACLSLRPKLAMSAHLDRLLAIYEQVRKFPAASSSPPR
jgi:UDP-glucose:(heptosyl)LPS alpha-1,3-glucosyltransferase